MMSAYSYNYPTYNIPYQQGVFPVSNQQYSQYNGNSNYDNYQNSYPNYPSYSFSSYSYPSTSSSYQSSFPPSSSWYSYQQPDTSYNVQKQYQSQPVFDTIINGLSLSYPSASSSSSSTSSSETKPSPSYKIRDSPKTFKEIVPSVNQKEAWQGKVGNSYHTRCHNGKLLPFRSRCNKIEECSEAEDEYNCDWHKDSSIPEIANFEEFSNIMSTGQTVIVEFFAPWCPACVTFLPELEKLQSAMPEVPIYKVNTDDNQKLKDFYDVTTYPRVLLFTDGQYDPVKYEKSWGLKFEPLINWVKMELGRS